MSFDEAVVLLGLTVPFTAKDVRRAYLRLLKVHKPESDPDGFMRLRQAYEMFEGVERVTRRDETPPPDEPAPETPAEERPSESAAEAAVEAAEEAASDEPAAAVDESDLPPWQRAVPEDPKVAAAVLADWLQRAKSDPNAPPPPMGSALSLLWAMLDRRAFKTAGELYRAIDDWLAHIGGARGQVSWGLTQGLWEMRKQIPEELYSPMVRAVATRDLEEVERRIQAFERERPGSAGSMLYRLESDAPQLAAVFGKAFAAADRVSERRVQRAAPQDPPKDRVSWGFIGWALFALLSLVRVMSCPRAEVPPPPATANALLDTDTIAALAALRLTSRRVGSEEMATSCDAIQEALRRKDCTVAHREVQAAFANLERSALMKAQLNPELLKVNSLVVARCSPYDPALIATGAGEARTAASDLASAHAAPSAIISSSARPSGK